MALSTESSVIMALHAFIFMSSGIQRMHEHIVLWMAGSREVVSTVAFIAIAALLMTAKAFIATHSCGHFPVTMFKYGRMVGWFSLIQICMT
jgi:hypothetical protein